MRTTSINKSLYKPILFVGCERLPFTLIILIGGVVIMAYQSLIVCAAVLVFYFMGISLIRKVNKDDPQYFRCLWRYIQFYQDYYPANAFYPGKPDPAKKSELG